MPLAINNILSVKTDEDIITAVNAKSHITAACFKLDDNDTVNLVDAFGNVDNITLDAGTPASYPIWNSGTSGEPDGFIELDANSATDTAYYLTPGTETAKASHNALLKTSDVGVGNLIFNFWINSPGIDPSAQENILSFGSTTSTDGNYHIYQNATNLEFRYDDGVGNLDAEIPNGSLSNDTWHNVTVDISSDSIDIYLDGDTSSVDSIAGANYDLNIDPASNSVTTRGLSFLCTGAGGSPNQAIGSSTRTVYLGRMLIIKSTTTQAANIASLVQGLYRKGLSGFAPELLDL